MKRILREFLPDEAATLGFARVLERFVRPGVLIFLRGELGAGKTTLVRGILRRFGYEGSVKSPTYTLVEPYETSAGAVYHFDFYRIADAGELEFIGIDELVDNQAIKLVEWAERAVERLPLPDFEVYLQLEGTGRTITVYENDR